MPSRMKRSGDGAGNSDRPTKTTSCRRPAHQDAWHLCGGILNPTKRGPPCAIGAMRNRGPLFPRHCFPAASSPRRSVCALPVGLVATGTLMRSSFRSAERSTGSDTPSITTAEQSGGEFPPTDPVARAVHERFQSKRHLQRFVSIHNRIANLFHIQSHGIPSSHHRGLRAAAMNIWAKIAQT